MPTFESLSSSSISDQTRNLAERKNYEEESRNHDRKSQQKGDITTTGKNHKGEREKSVLSAVCCISKCSAGCENWLRGSGFQAEDVFVRRRARAIVSTCTMPAGGTRTHYGGLLGHFSKKPFSVPLAHRSRLQVM
jgi:hypothetical protein